MLVYLSKVVDPGALENPAMLLRPDSTLPATRQIKCWVSVGTTMLLRIGDLWQDQTFVARPEYEQETFKDLVVDRDKVTLVKAGSSFDDDTFLLPLADHPWHLNNTHSYCIRAELPDGKFLVVPCMEMARFYFGSSSALLSCLFEPPLTRERLYGKMNIDPLARMMVDLAEGMSKASAEDIARIAGSVEAWRAAVLISTSCLKAATARKDAYPQAVFPFEGTTTLQAVGKWLPRGQAERGTFIAFQLLSCSHPFPFKSLRFKVAGAGSLRRKSHREGSEPVAGQARSTKSEPKNPVLGERDPSSKLAPTTKTTQSRRRFIDLEGKRVTSVKGFAAPSGELSSQRGVPVEDLGIGAPGSSGRIRPVGLVEARGASDPSSLPAFLRPVVRALEVAESLDVKLLSASNDDGWTVPVTLIADMDGVIDDALFVAEDADRPRRTAVFSVAFEGECAVLVVVESDVLIPMLYPVGKEELSAPWPAIQSAAKDFIAKVRDPRKVDIVIRFEAADADVEIRSWLEGILLP